MKSKLVGNRSSYLVAMPVLAGCLVLGVLSALWGMKYLASVLLFYFLLGGISRLWAILSAKHLDIALSGSTAGAFPGETFVFKLTIKNQKFLPLLWAEVFFPLEKNLCMTPEQMRVPEEWELPALTEQKASLEQVGEKRLPSFLWYEERHVSFLWTANRRGVYSTEGWRLRTGDGFGLSQVEYKLSGAKPWQLAVYPKLVDVSTELFLRNQWNADTGARGVMADPTVIRSTRRYETTDSVKQINWRMVARGQPLTVNVYEDILPRSVCFLFDGESFGGKEPHWEEMEEALSILASELVRLEEEQVECALCLPRGRKTGAISLFGQGNTEDMLWALAGYEPEAPRKDEHGVELPRIPMFRQLTVLEGSQRVGHFYYIAYNTAKLENAALLKEMEPSTTLILTMEEPESYGEFELVCLNQLRVGGAV